MREEVVYKLANYFFFGFHIALIFFNLFGWTSGRFRKWNLITLCLTAFSWFVLGIFYGFGYCFLTEWHWQVREKLGYTNDSNSYIHFLVTELTNISIEEQLVDILTAMLFFAAFAMSIYLNLRDRKQKST
jgi:hypothetical protein